MAKRKTPNTDKFHWGKDQIEIVSKDTDNKKQKGLVYKSGNHTGAMVAFFLPRDVAEEIAIPDGEAVEDLHITLAYLGKAADIEDVNALAVAVARFSLDHGQLKGRIQGTGRFTGNEGDDAFYASFDCPELPDFRQDLVRIVEGLGQTPVARDHGFVPHITLQYIPQAEATPNIRLASTEIVFDHISLVLAGDRFDFPLRQAQDIALRGTSMEEQAEYTTKAGARNNRRDQKEIQAIHDATEKLGASCVSRARAAYKKKAGARTSRVDKRKNQKIHDLSVELGAVCKGQSQAYRAALKGELGQFEQAMQGIHTNKAHLENVAAASKALGVIKRKG